jgi:CTP synthase (UTP-ammonia lyase)
MRAPRIALVGDYSDSVTAHRAIPVALGLARDRLGLEATWEWVATRAIRDSEADLRGFKAVWTVPASPYENEEGAIGAIRWARVHRRPFLGTCGGFQHALLEFARNVAGIPGARHAESDPGAADRVITALSCSHVEKTARVNFDPSSLLGRAYGAPSSVEGYRCNYGLNPAFKGRLEAAGLRFSAWDEAGDVRGAELPGHPFFAGVLFQPERAALRGAEAPLVTAFIAAAAAAA